MSVPVGGRTRSARLRKKEVLVHGSSILAPMAADLSRYDDWLRFLTALPDRVPALQVVVVNGSAVTGGWDEHSDLDVEAWCSGDAATTYDAVLALVRHELRGRPRVGAARGDVAHGRQCFIHLQPDAADLSRPTRLLDLVVRPRPSGSRWTPAGTAYRWSCTTRTGLLASRTTTRPRWRRSAGRRWRRPPRGARPRPGWSSGRSRAATWPRRPLHLRFAVEPLVRLLRIQHCPARHDFGLRYLRTDLPDGMAERVEALLPGPDLAVRTRAAFAWQDEVLRELR